jgi:hypothetical protein
VIRTPIGMTRAKDLGMTPDYHTPSETLESWRPCFGW